MKGPALFSPAELARMRDNLASVDPLVAPMAGLARELVDALLQWDQVREGLALLDGEHDTGFDSTWPAHGNAPLAVAALYSLQRMRLERLYGSVQTLLDQNGGPIDSLERAQERDAREAAYRAGQSYESADEQDFPGDYVMVRRSDFDALAELLDPGCLARAERKR